MGVPKGGFFFGKGGGELEGFWSPCVLVQTLLLDGEAGCFEKNTIASMCLLKQMKHLHNSSESLFRSLDSLRLIRDEST